MTADEAREILKQALLHVNLVNLGRTISALGEYGYNWITYDNSKWRADKNLALRDALWLKDNAEDIYNALNILKEER
jgi:hypothetical protein